ncbi:cubilin [Eurytemora carolleeae]|uniref:cubilin n=1 Tax=Eurytemora carolleeae TaxID=1294199 RepID=UPI000C78B74F|nr:cubilin [Eurytemora carolleeae]|eukprot:XP_023335557.1 cubilin-like [Eurytemora affinis]
MIIYHTLIIIFILVNKCLSQTSRDVFNDYARIRVEGGTLILQSAENKNISFQTQGSGLVNINGEDLSRIISGARNQTFETTNTRLGERLRIIEDRMGDQDINIQDQFVLLERRLSLLENKTSGDISGNYNKLKNKVKRLKGRIDELEAQLNLDSCSSNPCKNGGSCIDTYQGFICQCTESWEGPTCEVDVNECYQFAGTDLGCQNGASCQNLPGTYRCHCTPGFYGIHCTRKTNSCSSGTSQELCGHGLCVDGSGSDSYTCICDQGWTKDSSSAACNVDINECTAPNPPCSRSPEVLCINTPGSFQCGPCPQGYSGNGFFCNDLDECRLNNGGCSISPIVQCINTQGSRSCGACPSGYSGDGVVCSYLGPCHMNNGGCHPMATCVAMSGIVRCFCAPGYGGSGIGPFGCQPGGQQIPGPLPPTPEGGVIISPCASSPCRNGGTCLPSAAGFTCQCASGFTGLTCMETFDPCASAPCQNGATCRSTGNQMFQCECGSGFSGTYCEEEIQSCGGEFFANSGHIDFPTGDGVEYGHELTCNYLIGVEFGQVVRLNFTEFHMEGSGADCYDWLVIYDGSDQSGNKIGRYCGVTLPGENGTIYSNSNQIFMSFRSDHSIAGYGFKVNWNASLPVCGGLFTGLSHGSIKSPGYPGQYPHNADCTWTISVEPGKRIQFHFATLSIETHSTCEMDKLEISEGDAGHVIGQYCNSTLPPPITSSGSEVSVRFTSDASLSDNGFLITWSAVPGVPGCGGLLSQAKGEFRSPRHPESYDVNLNCQWIIRVPPADKIVVEFGQFELENQATCEFDYLEIRDGGSRNSPLIGRYCGTTPPPTIKSTSNQLYIQFRSDYSVSHSGFRASYKTDSAVWSLSQQDMKFDHNLSN